jgi:hypothetical protein
MFRGENKFKDNVCVMYKSVDDLIQKNKGLIGRTRISNLDPRRRYFTRC